MLNRLNGITAYTGSKPLRGGEGEGGGEREISTQPTLSWYHSTLYIFYLYVVFPISPGVSTLLLPCTLRQQKNNNNNFPSYVVLGTGACQSFTCSYIMSSSALFTVFEFSVAGSEACGTSAEAGAAAERAGFCVMIGVTSV